MAEGLCSMEPVTGYGLDDKGSIPGIGNFFLLSAAPQAAT